MPRVVVVGAGISGLATAHALLTRHAIPRDDLLVLDAAPAPGGLLATTRRDGYLVEWGANGFLDNAPATLDLVHRAGLSSELVRASPEAARRFVVRKGRLVPLPSKPPQILSSPVLPLAARLRLLREPFIPPMPSGVEESVAAFARRRLGPATVPLADAFVTGVYAADPERLSLDHAFPQIRALETRHGSLFKGLRSAPRGRGPPVLTSLRDGMAALPAALARALPVRTGVTVERVARAPAGGLQVATSEGTETADAVVLALPPTRALALAGAAAPPQRTAPVALVALGFSQEALAQEVGFGFLAPREEGRFVLGAVSESNLFPRRAPEGHALLRCIIGGARDPERAALPDTELVARAVADLRGLGVIARDPTFAEVVRPRGGIPQIELGHGAILDAVAVAEARTPGLHVTGAGLHSVAVNGLVAEADATADRVAAFLGAGKS